MDGAAAGQSGSSGAGDRVHAGSARAATLLSELGETVVEASTGDKSGGAVEPRVERLMGRLSERAHAQHRVFGEYSLLDDPEAMRQPTVIRRALGLALVLRQMPVYIQDDELLVGGRTVYGRRTGGYGKFSDVIANDFGVWYFPTYATKAEEEAAGMVGGAASNHATLGYQRVLSWGLRELREYAGRRGDEFAGAEGESLPPEDRERRVAFLKAAQISADAVAGFARRYAELARQMAGAEAREARRAELTEMSRVCERVASDRPASFREALQLFLFARVASMVESYGCMPLGRLDQYLYRFYQADLERGAVDRGSARELVECLFIKLNEEIDVSTTDDCLRIMVGGQTPDGQDATNDLTYVCMEAAIRLRLPSPKVGVRLHRGTPPDFFRLVVETIKLGINGLPEIYNDESIVPGLLQFGIPLADALDYSHDGCSEVTLGGKSDFYPTWSWLGMLRLLPPLLAECPDTSTFDDIYATYKQRLVEAVRKAVSDANRRDVALGRISPAPFFSSTLEGCLEKGLDKTWGGALYNMTGLLASELVNVANSLAAIRQAVYQDRVVTLADLKQALAANFEGQERLRQLLRNRCPKFGNDDDGVDLLAADLAQVFIQEGQSHANPRGGRFSPGFFDFGNFVGGGKSLSATPDGRKAGDSLAGHLSPVGGTDRSGATANLRSMWKVTRLHPPLGTMVDLRLHPSSVRGDEGTEKLAALIRTFLELDGKALQFNVVDAATLRAAQRSPEKYRDLLVRVWGFSAYFVELSTDFQEHIITRTEHAL